MQFSTLKTRIALPASIALITVAWFSPLRQWQTKLPTGARVGNPNPLSINNGSRSLSGSYRLTEFRDLLSPSSFCGRATLKSGILNSALKLFAVPFVSAFFCHFYNVADLHDVSAHDIGPSMGFYWNYLWVNILSSFGVYLLGYLACSMGLQRVAFAAPLLIVTPVCLFLSSVHWSCKSTIIRSTCGFVTGSEHYHVLVIAALFWVGMLCYVLLYIWKPQRERMAKEKDLFLIPYSYSGKYDVCLPLLVKGCKIQVGTIQKKANGFTTFTTSLSSALKTILTLKSLSKFTDAVELKLCNSQRVNFRITLTVL